MHINKVTQRQGECHIHCATGTWWQRAGREAGSLVVECWPQGEEGLRGGWFRRVGGGEVPWQVSLGQHYKLFIHNWMSEFGDYL